MDSYLRVPEFYVNVEFTKLKVLKQRDGTKIGFSLNLRDICLEFVICKN